jgi:hypothetical protein
MYRTVERERERESERESPFCLGDVPATVTMLNQDSSGPFNLVTMIIITVPAKLGLDSPAHISGSSYLRFGWANLSVFWI